MNRRGFKKMPFSSRSKRANGASSSTCPHQCRSFHPAGRSHCHGNRFCTRSGTSRAGWHSGSGCGTGSDPPRTHRYLRTYTQVSEHTPHTFPWSFISVRPHFGHVSNQCPAVSSLAREQKSNALPETTPVLSVGHSVKYPISICGCTQQASCDANYYYGNEILMT